MVTSQPGDVMSENVLIGLSGTALALVTVMYGVAGFVFLRRARRRAVERQFFRAVSRAVERDSSTGRAVDDLTTVYRRLSDDSQSIGADRGGLVGLVERLFSYHETMTDETFADRFGFPRDEQLRSGMGAVLEELRAGNPFHAVPSKAAGSLRTLQQALEGGNAELGQTAIIQIAEEVASLDNSLRVEERRNTVAVALAIAGAVLTLVLGSSSIVLAIIALR